MPKHTRIRSSEPAQNFAQDIMAIYEDIKEASKHGGLESFGDIEVPRELATVAQKNALSRTLAQPQYTRHMSCDKPRNPSECVVALVDAICHDELFNKDKLDYSPDYIVHTFWQRMQGRGLVDTPTQFARAQEYSETGERGRKGKHAEREEQRRQRRGEAEHGASF